MYPTLITNATYYSKTVRRTCSVEHTRRYALMVLETETDPWQRRIVLAFEQKRICRPFVVVVTFIPFPKMLKKDTLSMESII